MKFKEFFYFELAYQLRRPANWIYFVVVLGFCCLTTYSLIDSVQEGDYYLNSPVIVSLVAAVSSMFGLLLTAALCGNAAVRDKQTGMQPLFYTSSLGKFNYLGGRFLAILCLNLVVLVFFLILLFATSQIPAFKDFFTTNHFISYATAFLLFALPNVVITTGILFSVSLRTGKTMVAYLTAAMLFFLAFTSMDIIGGELGKWDLAKKLDLSGLTILKELRIVQTPLELRSAFVTPDRFLLLNRLLWIGGSLLLLVWSCLSFSFTIKFRRKKKSGKAKEVQEVLPKKIWSNGIAVPPVTRSFDLQSAMRQILYFSWESFLKMFRGKAWLLYPALAIVMVIASEEVMEGQLGVPMIITSYMVLQFLKAMGVSLIVALLTTFYAGNLVWKEREARLNEMTDASPVPDAVLYLSKFFALLLMILFLQVLIAGTGIIVQLLLESPSIDLLLYTKVLFGLRLPDLMLFAVVAFLIHILVNHKYVGHLIAFIAFYYMYFPGQMGLHHNLLIFGAGPEWSYSEMNGFGSSLGPWFWFKLYWAAWAIVLAMLSRLFWVRGKEQKLGRRLQKAKFKVTGTTAKVGLPVVLVVFLLGGYIFYNTNLLNNYTSAAEQIERRAAYEKIYGRYQYAVQPVLTDVKLQVEIYPEKQEAEIIGNYMLVNKSGAAIDTLHISTTSEVETGKISFSKRVTDIIVDDNLGHRIYKLEKPLQPGDSISLEFLARFQHKGFSNHGLSKAVVANGTYIGYHLFPLVGYKEYRELSDRKQREKFGLPPQPDIPSLYDRSRRMDINGAEKIHFEAVLGTSKKQKAITAGTAKRTWEENDRHYFHYATDVPITHNYEIFSAEYDLHEAKWKNVDIQIYYHPEHTRNLDRMVFGVQRSLEYFSENFSNYPHSQVRLVEFPGSGVGLNGNPVTMSYSEGFSFFAPEKDHRVLDFPFAVTGHEVAHQWWGNELRPAHVEGAPLLTESLAWYSSWMLVENTFGKEHLENLLMVMRQEYLTPRSAADLPLLRSTDAFSRYRKGPFALYTIKEYIGEEKVNLALKRLLEKFDTREPPLPVSLDLYTELQEVTPDSLQYLLKDLFEVNTFWELEALESTATKAKEDKWIVTFNLTAKKIAVDEKGLVTNLPMQDHIDLAIYANSPKGELGDLLYRGRHKITSGQQTFTLQVSGEPDLVGIDPQHLLIDNEPLNNFKQLSIVSKK